MTVVNPIFIEELYQLKGALRLLKHEYAKGRENLSCYFRKNLKTTKKRFTLLT